MIYVTQLSQWCQLLQFYCEFHDIGCVSPNIPPCWNEKNAQKSQFSHKRKKEKGNKTSSLHSGKETLENLKAGHPKGLEIRRKAAWKLLA